MPGFRQCRLDLSRSRDLSLAAIRAAPRNAISLVPCVLRVHVRARMYIRALCAARTCTMPIYPSIGFRFLLFGMGSATRIASRIPNYSSKLELMVPDLRVCTAVPRGATRKLHFETFFSRRKNQIRSEKSILYGYYVNDYIFQSRSMYYTCISIASM